MKSLKIDPCYSVFVKKNSYILRLVNFFCAYLEQYRLAVIGTVT